VATSGHKNVFRRRKNQNLSLHCISRKKVVTEVKGLILQIPDCLYVSAREVLDERGPRDYFVGRIESSVWHAADSTWMYTVQFPDHTHFHGVPPVTHIKYSPEQFIQTLKKKDYDHNEHAFQHGSVD